jgi:3',5'-cyclic AMP phosphodiesterase CpdA
LHGDLPHAQRVLRLAGLVDHRSRWIGKRAVLVQTGDIVDRGRDTIALYAFFDQLRAQAEKAGGVVVSLLGNHEMMNAFGDWWASPTCYVSAEGLNAGDM